MIRIATMHRMCFGLGILLLFYPIHYDFPSWLCYDVNDLCLALLLYIAYFEPLGNCGSDVGTKNSS